MEHHRSTLAAAALAVLGLVAAAHSLYPGDATRPGDRARPDRGGWIVEVAAEAAPVPAAWADPPRRLRGPEPAELTEAGAWMLADRPTIALPTQARMAPRLPGALVAPVAQGRSIEADPIGDLIRGLHIDREG